LSCTVSSKIADKKQAPTPLGRPKVLGIVYDPSEINASPSHHSGSGPPSRFRHWNFGVCERFKHGLKITPSRGRESANDVLKDRELWILAMCCLPHFTNDSDCFPKQAAALVSQPATAARET